MIGEKVDCRHRAGIRQGFASPDHILASLHTAFTSSQGTGQINKYIRPSSIITGLPYQSPGESSLPINKRKM